MTLTMTIEEDRTRRRLALSDRMHGPAPDRYRAIAEWWRISAEESMTPEQHLAYADNQERLAADMEARPRHYKIKPLGKTDWEWSGLAQAAAQERA